MKRSYSFSLLLGAALGLTAPAFAAASATPSSAATAPVQTNASAPVKLAVLMPAKGTPMDNAAQYALNGILAANYASKNPAEVLIVRPGSSNSILEQVEMAARAGAMAAIGPLDRQGVMTLSRLDYLALPIVTLNEVDLFDEVPLSPQEIEELSLSEQAKDLADAALREINKEGATPADQSAAADDPSAQKSGFSNTASVPGLIYAEDLPPRYVKYEPRLFPRQLLMLSLSMQNDAQYVANLAVKALPRLTESGERPKVLLMDHDTPLEKRLSESFEKELVRLGFAPDRFTVNLEEFTRINQFFSLVVEKDDPDEPEEELIDQETDPAGWRRQQLRIRKKEALKRARAAMAEPPYYAVVLAMDAKNASLVRSRLPVRSRVWGTPIINPGDTKTDTQAKSLTYDLRYVSFVDAPFVLNFDLEAFEKKYKVVAPKTASQRRLFALGVDAIKIAGDIARGKVSDEFDGLTGHLTYNLDELPTVTRRGQAAMVEGGSVLPMTPEEIVSFQLIAPGTDPLAELQKARDENSAASGGENSVLEIHAPNGDSPNASEKSSDSPFGEAPAGVQKRFPEKNGASAGQLNSVVHKAAP